MPTHDTQRQHRMATLALTPVETLAAAMAPHLPPDAACRWLRRPETGLVMLRGRSGGSGSRFNLGETSLTRASVDIGGHVGHAWVRGSDPTHAALAAIADALLQDPAHAHLDATLIAPLAEALAARRQAASREAAGSTVSFFTMVRGD